MGLYTLERRADAKVEDAQPRPLTLEQAAG
jgi:hypothetical protein